MASCLARFGHIFYVCWNNFFFPSQTEEQEYLFENQSENRSVYRFFLIEQHIYSFYQFEGDGKRQRSIQIIAHRLSHFFQVLFSSESTCPVIRSNGFYGARYILLAFNAVQTLHNAVQNFFVFLCLLQSLPGEIHLTAIVGADIEHAQIHRRKAFFQDIFQYIEVAFGFTHLFTIHEEVASMKPVTDKRLTGNTFGLDDFRLMMGKNIIFTAGVDVQRIAEVFHAHRAAFDVPAGIAFAPRRWPVHQVIFGGFEPQSKIPRMFLIGMLFETGAYFQIFQSIAGEPAVLGKRSDIEKHIAIFFIRITFLDEFLDQLDHLLDVGGGAGKVMGW